MAQESIITENGSESSVDAPLSRARDSGRTTSRGFNCLGRVVSSTRRAPKEGDVLSHYGWRFRKSRQCLRRLNCISSSDVFPTVEKHGSNCNAVSRNEGLEESRHRKDAMTCGHSAFYRHIRTKLGGFFCKPGISNNIVQSPSRSRQSAASSFYVGHCCLMRPSGMKPINSSLHASNEWRGTLDRGLSSSSGSFDTVSDEVSMGNGSSMGFPDQESSSQRNISGQLIDSGMSPGTPRTYDLHNFTPSVFSASSSRTGMPILFGMSHQSRPGDVVTSPWSHMSSPDGSFSNVYTQRTRVSAFQSPNLNRTTPSPEYLEGYRVRSTSGTPIFRSFRRFPFRRSGDDQECFTYGLPEQVFMWEANLIFAGLHAHDQYRDLRLDIDDMSYEDLLALEESIGNVCTGLKKDIISKCVSNHTYTTNVVPMEEIQTKCSICQVDFEEGNELGMLKCGHKHHFLCIEEWLLLKNQCPICKASASEVTMK